MTRPDEGELLDLAASVATRAGAFLLEQLPRVRADVATKTSPTDMVSEADRGSERLIVEALLGARPDDGVLGEEGASRPGSSGVRWVVDPLDGTTNYLYRAPGWSVSVAAEVDGEPAVGVVHEPLTGETFRARRGGGAWLGEVPVRCSPVTSLASALVATGFAYDAPTRRRQAAVLVEVIGSVRDVRRRGSAALDWCALACGRVDAYYERGQQPWDRAAGALIATEAGALVGDLRGGPPSTAMGLGASPAVFEPLSELLRAAGAHRD